MSFKQQVIATACILLGLGIVLWMSQGYEGIIVDALRIVLGSLSLLFIPGYWISRALFADEELDMLELIALSFAFSISVIPLLVFYLNLIGLPITARLVRGTCILVVICAIVRKSLQSRHKENSAI